VCVDAGQKVDRGGQIVRVGGLRFSGILATGVVLALAGLIFRTRDTTTHAPLEVARRGGQLIASVRAEPRTLNGLVARDETSELLTVLTQAPLVRRNRATLELEPWLAERADTSADGRTHTLHLRPDVVWSDGTPFTSADVVFTINAVSAPMFRSVRARAFAAAREEIRATAPDSRTVVLSFADSGGPGLAVLDALPIFPKHKLEVARAAGTLTDAWPLTSPAAEIAGTGPFVLHDYQPGRRVVLDRNPRYWRRARDGGLLPYLDRLVLELVPNADDELRLLESGRIDAIEDALRPEGLASARRAAAGNRVELLELGVAADADAFWFCLDPVAKKRDRRFSLVRDPEFRRAISQAVDREAFAQTVFQGEAVPIWGPVTPGNRAWFTPSLPRYPPDLARSRERLASIGLIDRDGNGIVEDPAGTEARFTVLTAGQPDPYLKGVTMLRDQAAKVGIRLEISVVEPAALERRRRARDYDAIYARLPATSLDPADDLDFWLSSGALHVWNPEQKTPATEWERQIDRLMLEQISTADPGRRRELFEAAQRLFAENLPALYFAAPRMYSAHSPRVSGVQPSVLRPFVLWNADSLAVAR